MFAGVYKKLRQMWGKFPAMVALVALTASTLVFVEAAPASAAIVTNNLVVNLDGTDTSSLAASSPTVWTSISPGSSNMSGTITNATRATGSTGGLNFVGTGTAGSYVNFGTGKGNVSGSITFDTWIKPGNLPANGWAIIASRWFDSPTVETTANHDFHFGIRTGASSGTLQLDTTTQTAALSGTTQFPLTGANKWYHVGFVIDSVSGKAQLFVNGVADSVQATMSHSGSANPQFWLGDGRLSASLAFNGTISKARLYGAALSQSNLFQNFNADSTLFGYGPVNTVTPTLAGTAKVGSTLQSTEGTWNDTTVLSTTYKWQSSPDGATWTDIAGAAASSYTTVTGDAGLYIRSAVTKTNGNGATTAFSAASLPVQTANGIIITNGGTLTGLTSTVPNDANIYQVTLASSNLSSTIAMPNNTGLTIVNGYATTASYMATAFTGAPIISFRGTGTAINSALATATYTGTVAQTDTVKLYYARGTATITDTDNYIPIYDNGKLTFHYYTYTGSATSSTWQSHQTTLQATSTQVGITSPYKWYLATPRYQIEDTRLKALVGSTTTVFLGGSSPSGTTNWYWAANSDGFTSATQFATGATGTSNIFNGASTTLPWQSSQPDYGSTGDRVLQYWYNTGPQGWDDTPSTTTGTAYASETFLTAPASSTGTQGVLAMTVRPSTAAGAPTALSASAPGSSVTLNWTAPASTGADAITDYVIQYSSDQTNWTTFTKNASTETTATVTGLNASTVYSFRVAAFTTLQGAWSQIVISSNTAVTGGFKALSGYSIPTNTTGTIRVLLASNSSAGRLWVTNTTNIDGGIRGTANFPDNNGYFPLHNYNPANINSAGQMIGLTDTSASDINTALASLRYQSPTASTDTISMWVSNGTEYVPILNGSNVEFHYYGKNSGSVNWTTARGSTGAGAAQTIDGVAANSPFLATLRYRAENFYVQSITATGTYFLNASDDTASPVSGTEGTWKWLGADASGIQFWSGSQTGSISNGEYNDWGWTSSNASQLEPNGGTGENCANIGSGYSNTGITNGWAWNDVSCTATMGYIWESYNTGKPYGSNSTNPAGSNYAALLTQQSVSVSPPVAAPTGLTASSTTSGQVDLLWSAPSGVSGITSYSVQYSTDGINWIEDRNVASTSTSESITGLTAGTYYHFRVAAVTSSSVGVFTSTYFTPTGTGKWNTWISSANTVSGLSVDASLNSYKMSVLLYASTSSIQLVTTTNLSGIRGTSNYASLTTAGQLIGLTGSGSDINVALASLKYNAPATTGNQSIAMWVSVGSTTTLPQAYVPVVNTLGQVEFHYFGYSSETATWALAHTKAQANTATINGQSVSGKYLATAESANQNAAMGDAMSAASFVGRAWLNGGDYTAVSSSNADNAWYWMGPDTGFTQFWSGNGTGGSAVNGSYYNWGASNSTTRMEPNGTVQANCLTTASATTYAYAYSGGAIGTVSSNGNTTWDDANCNDGNLGYVWEYISAAPVGSSTSGANYVFLDAQSVNVNPNADAPTAVSVASAGSTALAVSWAAPASIYNGGTISGYQLQYSTSSTFATSSTLDTGSNATSALITGLTANTTYYVRVLATGTSWQGAVSAPSSATTNSSATTITVVATGGGAAGTDYTNTGGILTVKTGTSANINASDIQSLLVNGDVVLGADNVTVSSSVTWATSRNLTLGSSSAGTVSINAGITGSGVSSGVRIRTTTYALSVKAGGSIVLSGSTPSLTIGGTNYTLIKSESELSGIATSGNFALAKPLNLTTAYTTAVANINFTGTLDGLGNTVNRMNISASAAGAYGLFANVSGSAILRNLGVTNAVIKMAALSGTYASGMLVGRMTAGTVTIEQVWSSGLINTSGVISAVSVGGIIGNAAGGTLTISKSWSSTNIDTSLTGTSTSLEQGGIIGGDEATLPQASTLSGAVVYLNQVYSNGNLKWASTMHRGIGGLFGLHYNTTAGSTITDSFSWATMSGPTGNVGGAVGVAASSSLSLTRVYQASYSICVAAGSVGFSASPSCDTQQTAGSAVTGISGAAWASNNGTTLVNLPTPSTVKTLYVQPVYTANGDGTFGTLTYQIVDGYGSVQNASALTALNLSVTGTAAYTIDSSVAVSATPYAVDYVSGLSLGGTAASSYTLAPWFQPTSATITKFRQTVNWSPTNSVSFGSGSFTPDALPVGNGGGSISYSLSSSGITGCSVNSSTGAITYTNGGNCAITAIAAANGNYVAGSTTVTFTIADPATLPTVTARGTGTGSMVVSWTAPTVSSSVAVSGYTLLYSTSSNMSSPTTVNINSTNTSTFISGLATNTTYYFQVRAIGGSTWTGSYTTAVSGSTLSTASTMTIAASGGATQGTGYFVNNGVVYATGSVTINASDINNLLANNSSLQLAADTVTVNAGLSWSTNAVLTLGNSSSSTVNLNSTIAGSGATAGVKILPTTYALSVKSGAYIQLTGATPGFNLGGVAYTVVNTAAGLSNVTASSTWALTAPITLTGSYTAAVKDFTFTGIMDGLGNTVNNMTIVVSATKDVGFYAALGGATVRNVGFTNVNISSATDAISTRLGSVAGNGSITASVTNNVSQVWATGFINQTSSGTAKTEAGGLFGGAQTGTLNISKSWSSVAVSTSAYSVGSGGIIGTNVGSFSGNTGGPNVLTISESYSTGNILRYLPASPIWYGNAGIIGVAYGTSATLTNVFSWGNINSTGTSAGTSTAGISGVGGAASITNGYTTYSSCGGGSISNCQVSQTAGSVVSGGTGFAASPWQSVNGTSLVNVAPPTKALYVKVVAPTDGSYGTLSYQIVDSTGTAQTLSSLNLTVSGTPTYTITASTSKGTYAVSYVSGLTLGGTSASVYSLNAWINSTSVTISKFPQTVTWTPTLSNVFGNGTITPSASAVSDKGTTITYSVASAGTTGCSVNASTGVITYTSAGTCTITASGDSTGDYLASTVNAAFVISAAPTITIVASGGGVSGTDYTIANGLLTASANVSVNASDLATALASGNVQLAGNVVVNSPVTWTSNSVLTLGGTISNTVALNAKLTSSGNSAGVVIKPASYSLDLTSGAAVVLSGTSPNLSIGGNSYTLVKSIAELANVTASGYFALAVPLTYSSTLSGSPITVSFAGTFDGLGNTVDNMKIVSTAAGTVAFISNLAGGTVRNLGITNVNISLEPSASGYFASGALAGTTTGGTIDQVWSTGFIRAKSGSTFNGLVVGGLVGNSGAGTLTISKSWSSVNLYGWGSTFTNAIAGGLIGGDLVNWSATSASAGGNVTITRSYATGDIAFPSTTGITGYGGIFGVHIGTSTVNVTDVFSWSLITINTGANYGGIFGNSTGTAAYLYTSATILNQLHPSTAAVNSLSNSGYNAAIGGTPVFTTNSNWYASDNGRQLVGLPMAVKNFFVRVIAPTDGSYGSMTYAVVNGVESPRTISAYGLSVSGTPTYSIASNVAISATPYNVTYLSGLTFTGTGTLYTVTPYPFATSVTISKYPQTVTWSPTPSVAFSSGSITPSSLATASGGTTITYAVTDAGTTGCTVNATTAVITATAGGNCVVTATAANAGNYLAASASVNFAIADASVAPTGVTTTPVGTGAVMVNWTAPTPAATSALTGYQVTYSTSSSMTSPTTVATSTTSKLVTGLSANTTYYFQVRAVNGTTWYGVYSTAVTGATPATGTTLTVAATGGTQNTTWKILDGVIYPIGSGFVNAADLQGLLQNTSVTLAADTVTISADVTWNTSQTLTLGYATTNTVTINADLTASGTSGGLVIAPATYSLDTKNGMQVILSGSGTTLSIGGVSYTLIRSIAGLASVTATGNYALSKPLTFGTTALTAAPMNVDFTGTFDGLGNTFDGLIMTGQSGANSGLFNGLSSGSLVRNLGITNVKITIPGSATNYVMVGVLAGWVPSGQSGTATINRVWTTGIVRGTAGSLPTVGAAGLVAWARSGTLNISQSWSSVNIDTSSMSLSYMTVGGLVGTNVLSYGSLGSGANVSISESYSSGNLKFGSVNWRGNGGLMGLAYATGTTTTVTDSFSYGTLTTTDSGNNGGIVGGYSQGTVTFTRVWTTQTYCGNVTTSGCLAVNVGLGTSVTGANTAAWTSSGASYLVNLPAPKRNLYVQVTYTNVDGSFAGVGNQIVDGNGVVQTLSSINLSKSGTPTYSIDSTTAVGTYDTSYVSGLSLGGTASGNYNLLPYPYTTSVVITKLAQSISYTSTAPTTAKVNTTYTPTATSTSGGTVTFTIDASSSSICSIASGVVTFNTLGTCVINANQAGATNWLAAPQVQQTAIATVKGDQSITFTSTAPTTAKVAGTSYTPTATATSGVAVTFTVDSSATSVCSITAGVVSFLAPGTCVVDADQSGNSNWNAATQASQTFTVAKGVQTITFTSTAPTTAVVAGASYTPTATKTAGTTNSITFSIDSTTSSVCSISGGAVSFQTVGTCKLNADLAGDSKYEAAAQVQQSFTVAKGSQTISFSSNAPNAAKVGGNTYTVVANAGPSTGAVTLSVDASTSSKCSVSGMVVTYLAVGDCLLNLNQAGDTNYNAAAQVQQTITITSDGRCPNGVVSGNYCLMRFNASGYWNVPAGVTLVDMLIVGAGGGGGSGSGGQTSGGGGGGGEVIESLAKSVTPGTRFSIVVGAGGLGGAGTVSASSTAATDGGASSISASGFTTITARGGGHGGSWKLDGTNANIGSSLPASSSAASGSTGLAGGGGGSAQTSSRTNAAGNGDVFNGGSAKSHDSDATLQSGGGGGGAGGAGGNGTTSVGGAGGIGKNSVILGSMLGGGGGGGKRFAPGTAGTASAGGGAGGVAAAGTAGTANTGGGGGGSGGANNGANGGSGVIVIRVALTSQTVAFTSNAPTGLVYGTTTTYTPTVSGTASEVSPTITVDASSSSVCSIADGEVSIIGAGTCTLNANQAGNGFYAPATQVQQSFTVAKQNQTINFTSLEPSNPVVGGATYSPTASGGNSGSAVTFSTSGSCTFSAGEVTFTASGTCTVQADQAESSNYNAAPQATQTFTVGKGTQTVAFTSSAPNNAVVAGLTYTPTTSGGASGNAVVVTVDSTSSSICSISAGAVHFNAVGDCQLNLNQAGNSNWNAAAEVTQTIAVGKGSQSLVFTSAAPSNAVVAGATYTPTATGGATNNAITFSIDQASVDVCELNDGVVSFVAVGDCKVLADQAGNGNYLAAEQAHQTFSVGKGNQVLLFTSTAPTNAIVGGVHYSVSAVGGATGNEVTFSVAAVSATFCELSGTEVSFIGAGSCVIEANQAGNSNYLAATQATQTFTVGKGTQTVRFTSTAPANAKVEGTTYTPVVAELGTEGSVTISVDADSSSVCSITGGVVSFSAVGTCTLNANQSGTANYNAADKVSQSFEVTEGTQTITFTSNAPSDAVVDGATYTPTAGGGSTGNPVVFTIAAVSAHICTISGGVVTFIASGDCDILANQAGNSNFHAAHEVMQSVSVGKGNQAITWTSTVPSNAVVGGSTYAPSATGGASQNAVSFRGDLNTASVCTVSNGVVSFVGVGTCVIFANQAGNSNYLAAPQVSQTITVGKGSQTISFTSTVPSGAKVGGATYTPTANGGATGNNVTFSIAAASAAVCSIAAGKVSFQTPGNCVIQANQAGNSNYLAATQATQTVSVAKGTQSIVFVSSAPANAKVDGTTYQPSATGGATGNSVTYSVAPSSSTICSVSGGVVSFNAVGSCVILANQAGNANYEAATQVSQTIGVAKGIQVLTFTSEPPSHAQVQGTTYTPVATGGNSGQAIVYSIDPAASALCRISNGVVSFQAVGDCIVHADQAGNSNYLAATRITQIFDITKGPQAISNLSTAPLGATVEGAGYQLSATGGGGTAPVTFSISALATDICTVTGDTVSFQAAGTCIVLFDQDGDANFNAANQVSQSFTVGRGNQTLSFSSQAASATVDGAAYTPTFVRGHSVSAVALSISPASSADCEVSSGSIIFHSVGDCVVDANQDADANYEAAPTVSQTISVTRGNQVPLEAHSSINNLVLGDQDPTAVVSLSGGSGTGATSWQVSAESQQVCSISGDVVTGFATGFCELTAIKDGDANYLEAVTTLTLTVSTGGQIPVQVNFNDEYPTYAPELSLTMTLAGGSGDGAVWFETLTPHVCNTDGSGTLQILHAGTCTVVGHKDGDSNFSAVSNEKTITIARAFQDLASIDLAQELTYSPTGSVSTEINLYDSPSEGATTYSVTEGSCSIDEGNLLVATAAGSCTVNADVEGDENYLPVTISSTFRIAKAAQDALSITRQSDAPASITWQGVNETKYDVSGGNGDGELTASSVTPVICSVDLTDGVLTVTGLDQGTCMVSVSRDGNDNYLIGTSNFDVEVLDLPDAPASLNLATAGRAGARSMSVNVTWPATVASDTTAAVNGYIVQTSTDGTEWVTANVDALGVDARSLTVTVDAWTKVYFRVGATSALDPADGSNRRWVTFNRDGDPEPDPFDIVGALVNISTNLAASTSGELVTITGTGFDPAITTEVELTSATPVFTARLGRAGAAALSNSKVVPVTVVSETELTFNLPKITMAKGVTRLATQIKILTTNGMDSLPVALDYIPKKLSQVMTLTGALPAANTVINVGTPLVTNGVFTSTGVTPVVTATPSTVCTAELDATNKLVITPVGPGKCSISVQSPSTPAYTASNVKTASYTVKSTRATGFSVTVAGVNDDGTLSAPSTFTAINTLLTPGVINVAIGDDPIDIPVTLSAREGTILFTVNPADEAAGRCTADPGEGTTGSISVTDVGDCLVTISQPADAGWYVGETIRVKIHAVARTTPAAPDNGQAVPADPEDLVVDPTDPDDPATPPVSLTINPNSNSDYSFGTEDSVGYDPLTGTFTMKTRTALVGTWTGYMKSPSPDQKWFNGKVVKKIQQYTNICPIKLVVKKDKKLKKRVLRVVAKCVLSPAGKTAMTQVGIQKIKIKYKRIRQYAKTGLSYQGTAKAKKRILKPINRTIILKIGRAN